MKVLSRFTLDPTSRLAGSLDFRPFFSQRNCQNTDLNNQIMYFWGTPKKPEKTPKNGQFWTVFGQNGQNWAQKGAFSNFDAASLDRSRLILNVWFLKGLRG